MQETGSTLLEDPGEGKDTYSSILVWQNSMTVLIHGGCRVRHGSSIFKKVIYLWVSRWGVNREGGKILWRCVIQVEAVSLIPPRPLRNCPMFPRIVLMCPSTSVPLFEDCPRMLSPSAPKDQRTPWCKRQRAILGPWSGLLVVRVGLYPKVIADARDGLEGPGTDTVVGCWGSYQCSNWRTGPGRVLNRSLIALTLTVFPILGFEWVLYVLSLKCISLVP